MSPCPPIESLEKLLERASQSFPEVEQHLLDCPNCVSRLESLAIQDDVLHDLRVGSSILSEAKNDTSIALLASQTWMHADSATAPISITQPDRLGPYEVVSLIGQGGMGQVFLAWDPQLKRQVALKVLRVDPSERPDWMARFRREVEVLARLNHPHILAVYGMNLDACRPFFVMEYLSGGSLAELLKLRLLQIKDACTLLVQLAKAVEVAHQHGILHRDLKPSNILFQINNATPDINSAKVGDFGLAKRLDRQGDTLETQKGMILGTPGYLAPEQAIEREEKLTCTVDVYSLGAILYECLTGRAPFKGASVLETLHLSLHEEPVPPQRIRPEVPTDLQAICMKCLERQPDARYPSAQTLVDDLQRFLHGKPTLARPLSSLQRINKWRQRSPAVASLLAVVALLIVGTLCVMARYSYQLGAALQDKTNEQAKTVTAQKQANENYRQARTTILTILMRAKENPNLGIPQLMELERQQYDDALQFFRKAINEENQTDPELRAELAMAIIMLADCNEKVNRGEEAVAGYQEAVAIYKDLLKTQPQSTMLQYQLASSLGQIGHILLWNRPKEAEQMLEGARKLLEALSQLEPANTQTWFSLAHTHHNLGMICRRGKRIDEAREHYQRCISISRQYPHQKMNTQQRNMMADSWVGLGLVAWGKKQWEESASAYQQARQLLKQLLQENTKNLDAMSALAALNINHGLLDQDQNQITAALDHFTQAIETLETARKQEPNFSRNMLPFYNAYLARARLHRNLNHFKEAAKDQEEAIPYALPGKLPDVWTQIVTDWYNANDFARSLQSLEQLKKVSPKHYDSFIKRPEYRRLIGGYE